jgi:hypothetical protein
MRSVWSPDAKTCILVNLDSTKPPVITALITDVALLLIMLSGVFRLRLQSGGFDLGYLLWKQVRRFFLATPEYTNVLIVRASFGSCSPRSPMFLH